MQNAFLSLKRYLEGLPLGESAVNDILACFAIKRYTRSQYFAMAGDLNDRLGFIVSGIFGMLVEKPGETVFVKNFLRPGDFLLATFDPQKENLVHIQALGESLVLEARYSDIRLLFNRYDDFRILSERGMQGRYQEICDRLEQLATLNASRRYQVFRHAFGDIEKDIPQHLIASYIGVTPTQLSRIRKKEKIG
jgi:CRP-like cAMP-binding protein